MQNKFIRRLLLVYFFLQTLPIDPEYWRRTFTEGWWRLSPAAIFNLAHYLPAFSSPPAIWPDWAIFALIAAIGAAIWNRLDSSTAEDPKAYYWVRTLVRYRLAIAMLAYGFIKLFPLLSPYPSISNLNTNYGDFTRWKLFTLSLGIVPSYEAFLGLVEIIGALLLLYRRSASIGAAILAIFLGNVFMSNWAYGGGDTIYSLYLILLALFIGSYDAQRLANLLFFQRPARPNTFRYALKAPWQRNTRLALKATFVLLFVVIYGFQTRHAASWQYPTTKGLANAAGVYNVAVFKKGRDSIGYSKTDSLRWRDIVFENWATLSIRSNRPVTLDSTNTEHPGLPDDNRDYELQGTAGRNYYRYEIDTAKQVLTLHNKNPHEEQQQLILHYDRPDSIRIVLVGIDQDHDSVYAVLERRDKKYLLEEARRTGRQKGLKL
jgi:hypothetical protein